VKVLLPVYVVTELEYGLAGEKNSVLGLVTGGEVRPTAGAEALIGEAAAAKDEVCILKRPTDQKSFKKLTV
jgi:hypothetical protein